MGQHGSDVPVDVLYKTKCLLIKETYPEMTQMVELANTDFNVSIITMLNYNKGKKCLWWKDEQEISAERWYPMEILEMKNTTSESKNVLDGLHRILNIKEESVTWR